MTLTIGVVAQLLAQYGPGAVDLIDHIITNFKHKDEEVTPEQWSALKAKIAITAKEL